MWKLRFAYHFSFAVGVTDRPYRDELLSLRHSNGIIFNFEDF
jgi:hypothetical protein